MKIEEQVISYKQAKRLKELGVTAPAFQMYWRNPNIENLIEILPFCQNKHFKRVDNCYAYSAAEVEMMIPDGNDDNCRTSVFTYRLYDWANAYKEGYRYASYYKDTHTHDQEKVYGETYAESICNILILLLERKEVKASECNKRLKVNNECYNRR